MKTSASRGGARVVGGLVLGLIFSFNSLATGQTVGVPGPSLAGAGPTVGVPTVTAAKPESKLWYHAGSWWGSLWSSSAQAFHIHRLNATTHAWVDTGAVIEDRPDSHSDALWDGTKLYIASHEFSQGIGGDPNDPLLVARYSFAGGTFVLDAGFPVTIGDGATETMVITKDSTGTVWAVWKANLRVYFSHTMGSDTTWSTPAILPVNTTDFVADDICSVVRFGNKIGVMWSDRVQYSFLFTTHTDGAPDTSWSPVEFAAAGEWDDHINLKADSTGRVFAAIRNSGEDVKLLVRAAGGGWTQHLVDDGTIVDHTRPIVLLDEVGRQVHVFSSVGGTIQRKSTSLDAISFTTGPGTIVIRDALLAVNNVSSTKQNVNPTTGLVVIAANERTTGTYWHHEVPGQPTGNGLVFQPVNPGVAGVNNTYTVTGCTPNKYVAIYAGLVLGNSTVTASSCPAGVQIGLGAPYKRLGIVKANGAGVATLTVFAPSSTAGKLFHHQAVEAFSCRASNIVDETL